MKTLTQLAREGATIPPGFESDVEEEQADWESMHCLYDVQETCEHEECVNRDR